MNIDNQIENYEYVIRRVMLKYLKDENYNMYKEDFMQIGRIALWNALKDYDKEKNKNFEAYAYLRVKNAFLDEIERLNAQKRGGSSITISINAPCNITINGDNTITLEEVLEDKNVEGMIDMKNFLDDLTDDEFTIIRLKSLDKTVNEIKQITGFSRQKIINQTQYLKQKLKDNVL